jgi:hypothetical protein
MAVSDDLGDLLNAINGSGDGGGPSVIVQVWIWQSVNVLVCMWVRDKASWFQYNIIICIDAIHQ